MARLRLSQDGPATPISNVFIEQYMAKANPIFSLVYIFTYKRLTHDGQPVDTGELASVFDVLESDVIKAWKHWESEGLVRIEASEPDAMTIVFVEPADKKPPAVKDGLLADEPKVIKPSKPPAAKAEPLTEARIDYPVEELEYIQKQCEEIRGLFEHAEKALGRTLKYSDLNTLYGLHDWLRLPVPVIKRLVEYCADNGHRHMNYIETVAINWRERGVNSPEDADAYIQLYNVGYRSILKAFGQSRNPAAKEIEYMDKWLSLMDMPLEVVLEACDKTIMALGKPNFKYADTIIADWHKHGVRTLDGVRNNEADCTAEKVAKPKQAKRKTKFDNFEGRKTDYTQLEKMETELINDMVNNGGNGR